VRKLVIIGSTLLLIWLVAMPALVGFYLRDLVPDWLDEHGGSATASYQPGWRTSRLRAVNAEADTELDLTARHFPPLKPGWIALRGALISPLVPRGAGLQAHLGLTGSWHISGQAELIQSTEQGDFTAEHLKINIAQVAGQPINLTVLADEIRLPGQVRPLLSLRGRGLRRETEDGRIRLGLDLQAQDADLGTLTVTVQAGPMAPEQLELMTAGLRQWLQSQPGSVSEGVALMTIASTWQQMADDGTTLELERLNFGEAAAFKGRWAPAEAPPSASGYGDVEMLAQWLDRLSLNIGDGSGQSATGALGVLSELGDVAVDNGTFRFSYPRVAPRFRPNPEARPAP
jgi:hypothetical protein